ncbi:MAG: TetR/AcrR family transcriptional regulator, partial [Flavobacterium johnsoniae]
WGVAEKRNSLRNIADERERNGERLFNQIADPYFAENALQYRAIMAILISGIYYLNLYKGVNAETFCGIDLTKNEGSQQIKGALGKIIDLVYEDHNKEN